MEISEKCHSELDSESISPHWEWILKQVQNDSSQFFIVFHSFHATSNEGIPCCN
ncbi:MAG: hypothetical protein HW421_688 [Ignavibacteria bacterium]|nr:hypothetical protein [Ignavibacteria bacterium]